MKYSLAEIQNGRLIAKGNDSTVYQVQDRAIKIYHTQDDSVVIRYLHALSRANARICCDTIQQSISLHSKPYRIAFDVINVDYCGQVDGRVYTVSRYSPFPNLDVLTLPAPAFEEYLNQSGFIRSDPVAAFLVDLNHLFLDERPTRTLDEFHYAIDLLSRRLDQHLGHTGHYIGKYNAKVVPRLTDPTIVLQITDTAVYIDRLSYLSP